RTLRGTCRIHSRRPGDLIGQPSDERSLLRFRAREQSTDFAGWRAHRVHAAACQQDRRPLGFLALDDERRWQPARFLAKGSNPRWSSDGKRLQKRPIDRTTLHLLMKKYGAAAGIPEK